MSLSNELISQFVKVTRDQVEDKQATTLRGTVKVNDDTAYVQIDGSDILTPVTLTSDVKDGDRVMVLIENHTATVMGNTSDPSATSGTVKEVNTRVEEFNTVIANKVDVDVLEAEKARVNELVADSISADRAEVNELLAEKANVEELEVERAKIADLETNKLDAEEAEIKYATIEGLTATDADIYNLKATYATVANLDAVKADVKSLDVDKLSAEDAKITYANIDFTNIGKAAMEYFYATSGLIEGVSIGDATIVGHLVGVTIKGDLIEGNTIVADKLVIRDSETGLYYKLNTSAETGETREESKYVKMEETIATVEGTLVPDTLTSTNEPVYLYTDSEGNTVYYCIAEETTTDADGNEQTVSVYHKVAFETSVVSFEQTDYNSLNGSIITAKSITATKVDVKDLVAFDATIGGFKITDNALYSGVKESVDNGTRGIYLDSDGQVNFGDNDNFIKYHRVPISYYKVSYVSGEYVKDDSRTYESILLDIVQDGDGNDVLTTTGELVYYDIESSLEETAYYCVAEYKYTLAISAESITYSLNGSQRSLSDLGALSSYVKIGMYEGEPCIELGKENDDEEGEDFKLIITNTQILFKEGSSTPAYINNETLHIGKAVIEEEMRVGGFVWKERANGNMSLTWEVSE